MYIFPEHEKAVKSVLGDEGVLFGRISPEKLVKILERKDCEVHKFWESTNSFGEFKFITFEVSNIGLFTFYGMGHNEPSDCFVRDFKDSNVITGDYKQTREYKWAKEGPAPGKCKVIKTLEGLIKDHPTRETPKTTRGQIYKLLESYGGPDGALCDMEDLEALGFDFD